MLCRSIHLLFYWILFENVMSLHRTKATLIGLLEAGRANEWIVTEKLGDALKNKAAADAANKKTPFKLFKKPRFKFGDRYYFHSQSKILSFCSRPCDSCLYIRRFFF